MNGNFFYIVLERQFFYVVLERNFYYVILEWLDLLRHFGAAKSITSFWSGDFTSIRSGDIYYVIFGRKFLLGHFRAAICITSFWYMYIYVHKSTVVAKKTVFLACFLHMQRLASAFPTVSWNFFLCISHHSNPLPISFLNMSDSPTSLDKFRQMGKPT